MNSPAELGAAAVFISIVNAIKIILKDNLSRDMI